MPQGLKHSRQRWEFEVAYRLVRRDKATTIDTFVRARPEYRTLDARSRMAAVAAVHAYASRCGGS